MPVVAQAGDDAATAVPSARRDPPARDGHTCVLARDGDVIALTESHGTWVRWRP